MTLADPRGEVRDFLRSCYQAYMRVPDHAEPIRVRWYRIEAPPRGRSIETGDYSSSNWDISRGEDFEFGEVSAWRVPYLDWADCSPPPWPAVPTALTQRATVGVGWAPGSVQERVEALRQVGAVGVGWSTASPAPSGFWHTGALAVGWTTGAALATAGRLVAAGDVGWSVQARQRGRGYISARTIIRWGVASDQFFSGGATPTDFDQAGTVAVGWAVEGPQLGTGAAQTSQVVVEVWCAVGPEGQTSQVVVEVWADEGATARAAQVVVEVWADEGATARAAQVQVEVWAAV